MPGHQEATDAATHLRLPLLPLRGELWILGNFITQPIAVNCNNSTCSCHCLDRPRLQLTHMLLQVKQGCLSTAPLYTVLLQVNLQ
jgi:hypothetical protein